jgi:hypothetical protein
MVEMYNNDGTFTDKGLAVKLARTAPQMNEVSNPKQAYDALLDAVKQANRGMTSPKFAQMFTDPEFVNQVVNDMNAGRAARGEPPAPAITPEALAGHARSEGARYERLNQMRREQQGLAEPSTMVASQSQEPPLNPRQSPEMQAAMSEMGKQAKAAREAQEAQRLADQPQQLAAINAAAAAATASMAPDYVGARRASIDVTGNVTPAFTPPPRAPEVTVPAAPSTNIPDQPSREQQAVMEANDGPQSPNVMYSRKSTEAERQAIRDQVALEELAAAKWKPYAPTAEASVGSEQRPVTIDRIIENLGDSGPTFVKFGDTSLQWQRENLANGNPYQGGAVQDAASAPKPLAPAAPLIAETSGRFDAATYERAQNDTNNGREGNRVAQASQQQAYDKDDVPTLDVKSTRQLQEVMKAAGMDLGKTGKNRDGVDGDCGPIMKEHIAKMCNELNIDPKKIALNGPLPPNKETEALMAHVVEKVKEHQLARENTMETTRHANRAATVESEGPPRVPDVRSAETKAAAGHARG